jgi:hypothetical protein
MVTGFSLVLYSRLHLLIRNSKLLRGLLFMVIINALLFHPPVIVGAAYTGPNKKLFLRIAFSLEIVFALQEVGLAGLYVYSFIRFAKCAYKEAETRNVLVKLVLAEMVVFSTDVILYVLLYMQYYLPREAIHSFAYAIKLKIEFVVLNSLVQYSRRERTSQHLEIDGRSIGPVTETWTPDTGKGNLSSWPVAVSLRSEDDIESL